MRMLITLSLVIALLMLNACGQTPTDENTPGIVCNKPYILVGTSCCLDKDDNSICDNDEKETAPTEPAVAKTVEVKLTAQDKLDATNFAQQLSRNWEQNKWSEIYKDIPNEEKEVISEKEFVFFMNISSVYARAAYDQEFQDALYGGYYTGFKRGEGLKMMVGDVTFNNQTGEARTTMHSMTFDNVILNQPVFDDDPTFIISYNWEPFTFIREDGRWKVKTIGVYFKGNNYKLACEATNYPYRCIFEYAKTFRDFEVCDETGYYLPDCYRYFMKPIQLDKAIAGCKTQPDNMEKDQCLYRLMLTEKSINICEAMGLKQDKYVCYGMDSAYNNNYELCWQKVTETELDAINNQKAQCIYGYVWITQEYKDCAKIPERANSDMTEKCRNLEYPFK